MALALNNLKRVDMPLNKETKPKSAIARTHTHTHIYICIYIWVYSMGDWVLQPWWGNWSRRRKTLNSKLLNSALKLTSCHFLPGRRGWWIYIYIYIAKTGLNSEFSLSKTACCTKVKGSNLAYYLPIDVLVWFFNGKSTFVSYLMSKPFL